MRRFRPPRRARLRPAAVAACVAALLCAFGASGVAWAAEPVPTALPATPGSEAEPNDSLANASAIASGERVRGSVFPARDVDLYRFTADAGDRVFATAMTNGSAGSDTDAKLRLLDSDGTTAIEIDDDDGSLASLSPSLAGATVPATGTYYLEVTAFQPGSTNRPYDLLLDVRSGTPTAEAEPNDGPAAANSLGGGFIAGARAAADEDWYALDLGAGDTVFLSLDLDPERDGATFNGRLAFGTGAEAGELAVVDDGGGTDPLAPDPPSEAHVVTVRTAGRYYVRVSSADAAAAGTYELSATVIPAVSRNCRTYAVTPSPGAIPDPGAVTRPIEVADAATIDHVAVALDVTHARMADVDAVLEAPGGNRIALATDIGSGAANSPTRLNVLYDDDAGSAPYSLALTWPSLQPEPSARLSYFAGQQGAGTWNLTLYDDVGGSAGTLAEAELILCARPEEGPAETVFAAGFESGDDGFTHSGAAAEWERGLPATQEAPVPGATGTAVAGLASCAEGTGCFKTDLDGSYDLNSSQDLVSPPISLVGRTGTVYASWAMWYQLESANFDHATVSVEQDGGGDPRPLFTWLGATMSQSVGGGGAAQTVPYAAGWGGHRADISAYAGRTIRLRFHLDSDNTIQLGGLGIDDVRVYQPLFALDVAIAGSGGGYVDSSPAGIDCGTASAAHPTCSVTRSGPVTLTAHSDPGSSFAGFSGGGCSGAAPVCTALLDRARSVTATFQRLPQAPTANGNQPPSAAASPSPRAPASALLQLRASGLSVFGRGGSEARCRMRSGRIHACTVRLVRNGRVLAAGDARRAAGARQLAVALQLTTRGRALLAERLGGVPARLRARAVTSSGGRTASARTRAVLQVERLTTPPGSWLPAAAALSPRGTRFLRGLRGRLVAVAALRCDGHSARTRAPAVAHGPVSRARAALLCRALARLAGGNARTTVVDHGTAEPIAPNDTESGRAKNRRVSVTVTHRPGRLP